MVEKKANIGITKIITLVLILAIIIIIIFSLGKLGIPDFLRNIFPSIFPPKNNTDIDYSELCPTKTAKLVDNYLHICLDEECKNTKETKLLIKDNKVYVKQTNDDQIGLLIRGTIVIYQEVIEGVGSKERPNLFFEVQQDLPSYEELLNLHLSYFYLPEQLCRDAKVNILEIQKEKAIREVEVEGKLFYYNVNDLIQNKDRIITPLFLDNELTQKANSEITKNVEILRKPETNEQQFGPKIIEKKLIQRGPEHYNVYLTAQDMQFLEQGGLREIKLTYRPDYREDRRVDNSYNQLGVDTGGDKFNEIFYVKRNNAVYMQLIDNDWLRRHESPWLLMDYWNEYRTFARAPSWATL